MELKLFKTQFKKKNLKNITFKHKNSRGFTTVFLLLILPTFLTLLTIIYNMIIIIEFKSEFRFKCINESLTLQRQLLIDNANSLKKSLNLLQKLKKINSVVKYSVTLSDYPKYESINTANLQHNLVYQLNYSWISNFYLTCGVTLLKKEDQWHHEIIYSTKKDKY